MCPYSSYKLCEQYCLNWRSFLGVFLHLLNSINYLSDDIQLQYVVHWHNTCRPGVGDISGSVLACVDGGCETSSCAEYAFRSAGIRPCNMNTWAPVGTIFQLRFAVFLPQFLGCALSACRHVIGTNVLDVLVLTLS